MDGTFFQINTNGGTQLSNRWMFHIDDVYQGRWINPLTGEKSPKASCQRILIADSLAGCESELIEECGIKGSIAIVADPNTWDALGRRVANALTANNKSISKVILHSNPHATMSSVAKLSKQIKEFDGVVAVGSGTVNDLVKYTTTQHRKPYCVFGTAPSMDGYASTTASMNLKNGLKVSCPAHSPRGVFLDLEVMSAAPKRMVASGYGDTLCTSVARIDWWLSHRLTGSYYNEAPYLIMEPDNDKLKTYAFGVGNREHEAIGWLTRSLIISGLGVGFTGVSNHGSMSEHQISHYIDCFAGERHPGTLHGEQVGLATLTMARIQQWFISQPNPPQIKPTVIDEADMKRRLGTTASDCIQAYRRKALDDNGAVKMNERLQEIWPELCSELRAWAVPVAEMEQNLIAAGGGVTAGELGIPIDFYREAVRHGHEIRDRFSFADIACDSGLLDDFAAAEN